MIHNFSLATIYCQHIIIVASSFGITDSMITAKVVLVLLGITLMYVGKGTVVSTLLNVSTSKKNSY